jgi:ATP-dependent Clp protease ATP-binding subunit ClpC
MSEYSGPWAADRLLLQAGGEPSDFLQQIRRQPFTVVLFDEIEKAHPDIFDVLMNVFDEGRLADRFGRVTWFRSAVLILTSNLGVQAAAPLGFGDRGASPSSHASAVRDFFRPEFFNRLDSVVTFEPLTSDVIQAIAEKELRELAGREGLRQQGVQLKWTRAVVEHLARTGFDPRYGARPLQRTLETEVVAPLARFLIATPPPRPRAVMIDLDPDSRIRIHG